MLTHTQLFVLRKRRRGFRPDDATAGVCAELLAAKALERRRGLLGWKLCATEAGHAELLRAEHSRDKVARAIALGMFDHLSFSLFEQLISSPDVEQYIDSQREVQRLILLHKIGGRNF